MPRVTTTYLLDANVLDGLSPEAKLARLNHMYTEVAHRLALALLDRGLVPITLHRRAPGLELSASIELADAFPVPTPADVEATRGSIPRPRISSYYSPLSPAANAPIDINQSRRRRNNNVTIWEGDI